MAKAKWYSTRRLPPEEWGDKELLKSLNEEGFDFHVHTAGEASSRLVLDGVEEVRKEPGVIAN